MQEIYRFIDDAIEADRQRYTDIADQIWDHPETRFEEFWSAEHLASALESAGFTVTRNVGNIPNAFIASFGQGKPVIALLGEYDALAGLSQQAGCAQPISATPGENGHGCGHNLLGTAAFAAAIAVKKWLEQYGQGGTVRFYGCPGEEGGSGKTFMVREGYLMMWMRHSPGTRKPLPACSIPARWQTFRHHGALKGSQHMPRIPSFGTQRP